MSLFVYELKFFARNQIKTSGSSPTLCKGVCCQVDAMPHPLLLQQATPSYVCSAPMLRSYPQQLSGGSSVSKVLAPNGPTGNDIILVRNSAFTACRDDARYRGM